eukprot:GFUD01008767.1.p1 GENE.GFUD01008767.1~~GFUD01008767.1.p1  ORF type:complete len:538 (+),score=109.14 GFUD01008767.1:270-1883(+)
MRVKKTSYLKLAVLAVFVTFVVINMRDTGQDGERQVTLRGLLDEGMYSAGNYSSQVGRVDRNNNSIKTNQTSSKSSHPSQSNDSSDKSESADSLAGERIHGLPNITKSREDSKVNQDIKSDLKIQNILEKIKNANKDQVIHNEDMFGPVTNDTTVIVVQVHNRLKYLRELIRSLSLAVGIDKTLLIFSHDVWDEELNVLVRSIDFSQTLQIFYPFSLQTHTHTFPGESTKDCPRDAKQQQALTMSCTNAAWPDIHGHYREAQFTQTKHHWWWKANHVFHNLQVTKNFQGTILFLEEDHYVSVDFLHVLSLMNLEKKKSIPQVDILCLGTYLRKFNFRANAKQPTRTNKVAKNVDLPEKLVHKLETFPPTPLSLRHLLWLPSFLTPSFMGTFHKAEVTEWISSKHNMGMAFTRKEWNKMTSCSDQFCKYDDYNWDWSLQHVSHNCMKDKLQVMMVKGPRVFHIGECGIHHKKSNCDSNTVIEKVKSIIKSASKYFFPKSLSVSKSTLRKKLKLKKANGGWGDKRDHELCMNFTLSDVS